MENGKSTKLQLPNEFSRIWSQNVLASRGSNNSICVYTKEEYTIVETKIDENIQKFGLIYPNFKNFIMAGLVECPVSEKGELMLPNFLVEYMGPTGEVIFEQKSGWLEIKREHP